ncbi:MAG: phosphoribosylanthranilate isomerase [Neomegalonema sp.]|nr:phosphoribosylanthranilate isomerase [Neomegalonema sp.]
MSVKICGLRSPSDVEVAAEAGARYIGFVFFERSPRHVAIEQAREAAWAAPIGMCKVGLLVDPDDEQVRKVCASVPIDMLQLHGSETPERVAQIRAMSGLPVMKAVQIATEDDLAAIEPYEEVADQILCDAKPKPGEKLPGGNGIAFDWQVIVGRSWRRPWMLAGGLTPENVAQAINLTGARQIDVSSGVESAPGVKDPDKIRAFIAAAQSGCGQFDQRERA